MTDLSVFRTALNALDMDRRHKTGDTLVRDAVWFMTDGHCAECKGRLSPGTFHVDHVKPAIRRGEDHITNYQPLCRSCNTSKGEDGDIDYRSDEVRWLLGIGDEPEKLRAEREARNIAAQQRLEDTFGDLIPTRVIWAWEKEGNPRLVGRAGDNDFDAIVRFDFDDDSQFNEIRCLLEMDPKINPEILAELQDLCLQEFDRDRFDGEFELPHHEVYYSATQSAFLFAVFPALETQDLLRRVRCRNDECTRDAAIPDTAFNGYCAECARAIRKDAFELLLDKEGVDSYWAMLGHLPNLRSSFGEQDCHKLYVRSNIERKHKLDRWKDTCSKASEIERLIGAERGD
jgi:hypothetical protein